MKALACGDRFLLRFDRGEELVEALQSFSREAGVPLAHVSGIGAADRVELMYFDAATKRYETRLLEEDVELVSVNGNLCPRDGKPFAHLHAAIGRPDFSLLGGHLKSARISVTGEFVVLPLSGDARRTFDPVSGLALLSM